MWHPHRKAVGLHSLRQLQLALTQATKGWMSTPIHLLDTEQIVADLDHFNEEVKQAEKRTRVEVGNATESYVPQHTLSLI